MKSRSRDKKLENLFRNHSMIFMGVFDEGFADVADSMIRTIDMGAVAAAGAPTAKRRSRGKEAAKPVATLGPEQRARIKDIFSGIREETDSQWPKDPRVFRAYVAGPSFDEGIKIAESYDFGRPKLTEELSDETLASYVFLLKAGDRRLGEMFRMLADWQRRLPRPPWALLR